MPRLNLKGKKEVTQTKDKGRGKPGRESRMCKSLAVGAWHLLEMGSRWQWGTAEDLGQVSNMMRFSRETTLVAVRRVDLNSKSETRRTVQKVNNNEEGDHMEEEK